MTLLEILFVRKFYDSAIVCSAVNTPIVNLTNGGYGWLTML
jgi:hypothetical protein